MSEARLRILRLLGSGRISEVEANLLLSALEEGYPEESGGPAGAHAEPARVEVAAPRGPDPTVLPEGRIDLDAAVNLPDTREESFLVDAGSGGLPDDEDLVSIESLGWEDEGPASAPLLATTSEEQLSPTAADGFEPLTSIVVTSETVVRILTVASPPEPFNDPSTAVAIRGIETDRVTVVRGARVSSRWVGQEIQISWQSGLLLLEIPSRLGDLILESLSGSVGLSGYSGPFTVDGLEGPFTVHGPRAPFRIRNVRGLVQVLALGLQDGVSTIAQSDGDVEIEAGDNASVSIRAVSTEGGVNLGDSSGEAASANLRRRGVWRLGAGTAQLNISTIRGKISVRRSHGSTGASRP